MPDLPRKLSHDAIVEALLEIRFEHRQVSEVVVGSLTAAAAWAGYQVQRLPLAEMPSGMREGDGDLRYQPILQLHRPIPGEILKIGPHVISLHVLAPYPGWEKFSPRLNALIDVLYDVVPNPSLQRVGLRYVNALTSAHEIQSLWDLNVRFEVREQRPSSEFMATYRSSPQPDTRCQVTIATPTFATGMVPGAVGFVDIDVATPSAFGETTSPVLKEWLEKAHDAEKVAFFNLWPDITLNNLREL